MAALVVKGTSRDPPKVEAQVRLLAGVLLAAPRFDGERDITRFCEVRVPGSIPGRSAVAEPKAAAGPGAGGGAGSPRPCRGSCGRYGRASQQAMAPAWRAGEAQALAGSGPVPSAPDKDVLPGG